MLTYRLAPNLVPDISGPGALGGLTPDARAETQSHRIDPHVADFVLSALLSTVLTAASALFAQPARRTTTVATRKF
ncbi:MAG TPA: hypothetical protein VGR06_37425 [Actinophytocola sp.]|uniref:hypothetical protein n=1 Tax=Actinophytocola sp. TaxID=1872138 RepID=UPI002DFA0304|nr:hypothetical protein [Actinophytocola sp.]